MLSNKAHPQGVVMTSSDVRFFTLIELLVVIAIVGILVSMLLPALNQAKSKSLLVKCVSNLRECGRALNNYTDDYNGMMPTEREDDILPGSTRNTLRIWESNQPRNIGRVYKDRFADSPRVAFCTDTTVYTEAGRFMGTGVDKWQTANRVESSYSWRFCTEDAGGDVKLVKNYATQTMLMCEQWPASPGRESWCHGGRYSNVLYYDQTIKSVRNSNSQFTIMIQGMDEAPILAADAAYDDD